jgi:type IV pilus assembly protein PilY1
MWTINPTLDTDFADLGQTWSTPTPIRVKIGNGSGQNSRQLALVFGGGYDPDQDTQGDYSVDTVGAGIYIVDALSGNLLWQAAEANANLNLPDMTNSIASDIRALDLTNDGLVDRLYASDLGGRVWRIDLTNGQNANDLAAGGVIASLGGAVNQVSAQNRRFYYAPDVALVTTKLGRYMHIGIGSGYRAHPLETVTQDSFYAIRDHVPFGRLTQTDFDSLTPVTDAILENVTIKLNPTLGLTSPGWKIDLGPGEKVLAESRTFADTVYFTTFTPGANTNPCLPGAGLNKLYAVNVVDGSPVNNMDGVGQDNNLTVEDRVRSLAQGGIAPEIVFLFPDPKSCTSGDCDAVYGFVGLEGIGDLSLPPYVRTYWEQAGSE